MTSDRRRGPRGGISAETILTAAERLLDRDGAKSLSLRRIALEAGVAPNAIYTYVPDMQALRNRLGDRFLGAIDLGPLRGTAEAASLVDFLRGVLEQFRDNPARVSILAGQRVIGPHALALNEALLDFFAAAGLSDARARSATGFLTEWVHGAAQLSVSEAPTPMFLDELAATDMAPYPRTAAMLEAPPSCPVAQDGILAMVAEALLFPEPRGTGG